MLMKILMVCLGNICRSPVAEGILRKKLEERKLPHIVDSAATSNFHIGQNPDKRAISNSKLHHIDISQLRGRQFCKEDFETFDRIYAMDYSNYENIIALAESEEEKAKVDLILNLSHPGENMFVPDPYFGGEDGFENVYNLLNEACDKLIQDIENA